MTVLVLGATGFIGPAVLRGLERRGVDTVAVSRTGTGPNGVAMDRRDVASLVKLARESRVTSVIDLLAYTENDTLPLLIAMKSEVGRWVMASSCDVYRNYEGLHQKAEPPPLPGPLDEACPLRTIRYPYRAEPRRAPTAADTWMDDYDKIPLEEAVRAAFGEFGAILRLPMIYGPGDKQRRFSWIMTPMFVGKERVSIDPAWLKWRTTYGYVEDVGDALATAALHPDAAGRTFNIGEQSAPDHHGWLERFANILDWHGKIDRQPAPAGSPIFALNLSYSLVNDNDAFRAACGWKEPTPLGEALERTIEDERNRQT